MIVRPGDYSAAPPKWHPHGVPFWIIALVVGEAIAVVAIAAVLCGVGQ